MAIKCAIIQMLVCVSTLPFRNLSHCQASMNHSGEFFVWRAIRGASDVIYQMTSSIFYNCPTSDRFSIKLNLIKFISKAATKFIMSKLSL